MNTNHLYFQDGQIRRPNERIFVSPYGYAGYGYGYESPFLDGLAGGLLASALLSPFVYGGDGFGYPYEFGYPIGLDSHSITDTRTYINSND